MHRFPAQRTALALAAALAWSAQLAGCAAPAAPAGGPGARTATIVRTANGVPHITAPDMETLAYGAGYAHAQDNVCQTAQQLVTVRGERSRHFGGATPGLLGRRMLPNEQVDLFIASFMDDAANQRVWAAASADNQALARGAVAGYNRYLSDHAGKLPAACNGQAWVTPMTQADFARLSELTAAQAATVALADAVLGAQPPKPSAAAPGTDPAWNLADAADALREAGLLESPLGSNAWAFGKDATGTGHGLLLGNPHFPWAGVNRFYQMHLTVPGQIDVMGVGIGNYPMVTIGFNKDVAWSHTVSTGKRFTLHELSLVPGDPTRYLVDGQPEPMRSRELKVSVRAADGTLQDKRHTVWSTRYGPVLVLPRAGINWTAKTAYAIQDANIGNIRSTDSALGFGRATSVADMRRAMANLGTPWVNTLAADRHGNAMYADVSVVPDVDAAQLQRCAPSAPAAALRGAVGIIVLDGSKSDCNWRRDPASPVPGLIPIGRMPIAVRSDWVHNSNDSYAFTNPAQRWEGISPMLGEPRLERPRTRAGLVEVPELIGRGPVTLAGAQQQLFENRNFMGRITVPDLLAACVMAPPAAAEARDGCVALRGWDRSNNLESRGAHLFREFWRLARSIPGVHRIAADPARPVTTPAGLKMDDPAVAAKVWEALGKAVAQIRAAGFAIDAPLGSVQFPLIVAERIPLHGGEEMEGVLNNLGSQFAPGVGPKGAQIDYGSSYIQAVTFDDRGPVAQAILTYGQSSNPASPHASDQMRLFSKKQWPVLPFHAADVSAARVGDALVLTRP